MISPVTRRGRYFCFCSSVPKQRIGVIASPVCAPNVVANDAASADRLADDDRRHLVEIEAAVRFGHVGRQQAQLAAALPERPGQRPVLLLEPIERRQDLLVDELLGGLADHPLLVVQPLAREHAVRRRFFDQPRPAFAVDSLQFSPITPNSVTSNAQSTQNSKFQTPPICLSSLRIQWRWS